MKKTSILIILILAVFNFINAQQRMRIPKGIYKLSKHVNKIPANCIDRTVRAPVTSDIVSVSTNSISLIGRSGGQIVAETGLQLAIEKGIIEITGAGDEFGSATEVSLKLLKSDLDYELVVNNSSGVIGFAGQNFDDLGKLRELEGALKLIDEKYIELTSRYTDENLVSKLLKNGRYRIDGMLTKEYYQNEDIKSAIDELIKKVDTYDSKYKPVHREISDYKKHLKNKYNEDNAVTDDFDEAFYELENSLEYGTAEEIEKKAKKLILQTKRTERIFDDLESKGYIFIRGSNFDYNIIKNKNVVVENPQYLTVEEVKAIKKHSKNPFVMSRKVLFENYDKPKEKFKFIVVGSEDLALNKALYEGKMADRMDVFTKYVTEIKSDKALSPYFEFVSSKEMLEGALEKNKEFRTITLYHNSNDGLLLDAEKSIYPFQDRLTCDSYVEGSYGYFVESIEPIYPQDIIHSFVNLINNNPNKNEFQALDFYMRLSKEYHDIQLTESIERGLIGFNAVMGLAGPTVIIWQIPTETTSERIDSTKVDLPHPEKKQ